ncbi:potassium/sodium hyperpolarization-activated cyclic nucleotide-gated channel 1 [Histomonas meleagridis]|uniref:potassium/sodium hyperpolarization-activated cyclic nucleotide-gated channel 1 n=1 Tax=Histomonas meleagridis TaxID=135588 RepID=UPI003559C756|nr:potassium/sodium hyperpolarization-activated cyclic nucleotide-gated channel 1 [Histomonas meleagridis]KAH0797192.1 potassium/sodium hyperpolarization-activated cyclic nucleotide-gated channel 1 [Histomonas meleagridis]
MVKHEANSSYQPKFFQLLDPQDQADYTKLKEALTSRYCRNRRGKRLETFVESLNAIRNFCVRGKEDDWKRCLVCGIFWIPNGIAINTRQLGIFIDRCKSSINGSLQKMGFSAIQNHENSTSIVLKVIPFLTNNYAELREWTVRTFAAVTPQPNLPTYNTNTIHSFSSPAPNPCNSSNSSPKTEADCSESEPSVNADKAGFEDDVYDDFCLTPSFLFDYEDPDGPSGEFGN